MSDSSLLRRLLTEPLFHFLLIGLGLFALYSKVGAPEPIDDKLIVIDKTGVERLSEAWSLRWNRPPTPTELQGLISEYVREEVLYREALSLGLDANDSIVRRRMAQKMDFLFRDLAAPEAPDDEALAAYLAENEDRFRQGARYDFTHIYLNPDKRGPGIQEDARHILEALLSGDGEDVRPEAMGDPFILQNYFENQDEGQISRLMGSQFAKGLAALETGSWQGPVVSGYGLHLVYIHKKVDARLPGLSEIRDRVEIEYLSERQEEANQAFYDALRAQYEIRIELPEYPLSSADGGAATGQ